MSVVVAKSNLIEEGSLHNGSALILSVEGKGAWERAISIPFTIDKNGNSFKVFEEPQFLHPVYIKAHEYGGQMYVDAWGSWDLRHFMYDHLAEHLQPISAPFFGNALHIMSQPECFQRHEAMQRLLEAKDCAVRAFAYKTL